VVLVAVIALLLLGTELLDWRWLVVMPLAAAAAGVLLALRRLPDPYRVAQILDERSGLFDAISTAFYFSGQPDGRGGNSGVRELQKVAAERAAESVDLRLAIPYRVPRAVYAMAALTLVASSLFALRYGLTSRLDLRTPLARIIQQRMGYPDPVETARKNPKMRFPPGVMPGEDSLLTADDRSASDPEAERDFPDDANPKAGELKEASKQSGNKQGKMESQNAKDVESGAENADDPDDAGRSGKTGTQGKQKDGSNPEANSKSDRGNPSDDSSLMSKIKDAMQNLLSKVKPQSQGSQQQSAAGKRENGCRN